MRIWCEIKIGIFVALSFLLITACSQNGAGRFSDISERFLGCSMVPPWPVKLNSEDSLGATFIRADKLETAPFYFTHNEMPAWEVMKYVERDSISVEDFQPFKVARFKQVYSDESINFDRNITVIRRDEYELVLPGQLGDAWEKFLEPCLGFQDQDSG